MAEMSASPSLRNGLAAVPFREIIFFCLWVISTMKLKKFITQILAASYYLSFQIEAAWVFSGLHAL